MKSSTHYNADASAAILAVGEPKSGKTNLMFAFPSPWIADLDLNLASATRRLPDKTFKFSQFNTDDAGKEVPEHLRWTRLVNETLAAIKDPEVKTICIDGLGVAATFLCDHCVYEGKRAGSNKTGKMELQTYGDLARLLRSYVMTLRASGKIVFVTSHQTGDKDEVTKAIRYCLAIPGQSKDTLGGLFTDVWATTAKPAPQNKVKYEIRTKPTGFHVALGTSFPLDAAIDVTDKNPEQIWSILQPKLKLEV